MLVLLKNHLNDLKDNIFKCFFKKYNRLSFFFLKFFFSQYVIMENSTPEEENIIKYINLFRLKKEVLQLKT